MIATDVGCWFMGWGWRRVYDGRLPLLYTSSVDVDAVYLPSAGMGSALVVGEGRKPGDSTMLSPSMHHHMIQSPSQKGGSSIPKDSSRLKRANNTPHA
jgi:hypothetical protein